MNILVRHKFRNQFAWWKKTPKHNTEKCVYWVSIKVIRGAQKMSTDSDASTAPPDHWMARMPLFVSEGQSFACRNLLRGLFWPAAAIASSKSSEHFSVPQYIHPAFAEWMYRKFERSRVVSVPLNTMSTSRTSRAVLPFAFVQSPLGSLSSRIALLVFFNFLFSSGSFLSQLSNNYRFHSPAIFTSFECGRICASTPFHYRLCPHASRLSGKAVPFCIRSPFTTLLTSFIAAAPYLVANSNRHSVLRLFCSIRSPWHIRQGSSVVTSLTHHLVASLFVVIWHQDDSNVVYVSIRLIADTNQSLSSYVVFFNHWQ